MKQGLIVLGTVQIHECSSVPPSASWASFVMPSGPFHGFCDLATQLLSVKWVICVVTGVVMTGKG